MKKSVLMKVFLILLPAMAVLFATTSDSVTVFDTQSGVTQAYSYFSLIPVENLQMCTPLAGILAAVAAILATVYVVKGSARSIRALFWIAPASATVAVIPILVRGAVMVIPNPIFSILMMVHWWLIYVVKKKPETLNAPKKENRLERH